MGAKIRGDVWEADGAVRKHNPRLPGLCSGIWSMYVAGMQREEAVGQT